ncbi:MAG: hypothetical protein IM585_03720 [Pseudanabaena sp. M135S2SP2A07QC]|jgi:hypothetical protein|uniref:hypothetical protein n=1 Tax=Microcystis sp. M155S2 TaxID=2771151 RepID=UPI0025895385|nr:hypothetical protein [Microcystis sp. M155S2]MCA6530097.1 hypothetical protein [Pseudanabaena sp. M125S2SP2A07QC]MCA6536169.1 hypothetical protein [Pseudanabaena sp. M176S2SP2A07QC]MCA6539682.1 hypothetical protein [Pseudanabaena sp. M037S2SP2A07QC]MCA6542292.1 hypothetical protein [Pseudanabaena sp. M074S1SP2A07QC]MCA6547028.1 hypothetical protein [Pseudanabaena sp. M152S2SP2A07QC]MCA6551132.1 hypothetical protein [Pseudanabaena sp. M135S2SP2A07QC]MCA6565591.1 hypothetical protein [Pseud
MLIINREPILPSIKAGPPRRVYGKTSSGEIILPLDFVLYELDPTTSVQNLRGIPETATAISAAVKNSLGESLGKIKTYTSPSIIGSVDPVVLIDPNGSGIDMAKIPDGHASIPRVLNDKDEVLIEDIKSDLNLSRRSITGQLNINGAAIQSAIFLTASLNVNAYSVTFFSPLQEDSRGTRVILKSTGKLLGMLIFTSNLAGKCNALVYPAHFIP